MTPEERKMLRDQFLMLKNSNAWEKIKEYVEKDMASKGRKVLEAEDLQSVEEIRMRAKGALELWNKIAAFIGNAAQPQTGRRWKWPKKTRIQ